MLYAHWNFLRRARRREVERTMRAGGFKTFWISFFLTAVVLAPLIAGTLLWVQVRSDRAGRVSQSESGIAIREPTTQNQLTVLVAVAGDQPAFVLARLDAPANTLRLAVIPAEGVVLAGQEPVTLAESYAAAGPARAAQLLQSTLGVPIDRYLALTAETLAGVLGDASRMRAALSGALSAAELERCGFTGEAADWTVSTAHQALLTLQRRSEEDGLSAASVARARAALWEAAARQQLEQLPTALPQGLRSASASLLTSFTAQDYYTLADTLEFLANRAAEPQADVLPGDWNAAARRYEFSDDTLAYLQAFFNASAAASASEGGSAPYPSTTVEGGQAAPEE